MRTTTAAIAGVSVIAVVAGIIGGTGTAASVKPVVGMPDSAIPASAADQLSEVANPAALGVTDADAWSTGTLAAPCNVAPRCLLDIWFLPSFDGQYQVEVASYPTQRLARQAVTREISNERIMGDVILTRVSRSAEIDVWSYRTPKRFGLAGRAVMVRQGGQLALITFTSNSKKKLSHLPSFAELIPAAKRVATISSLPVSTRIPLKMKPGSHSNWQ